jgi:S1-C subfamily serine protease
MRKIFYAILCLLMTGCTSGCALKYRRPAWDDGGDRDAAYAQRLMRQSVEVSHRMLILAPGSEEQKPLAPRLMGAQGSGVVVDVVRGSSVVLTAGHVCVSRKSFSVELAPGVSVDAPVLAENFSVWTTDGKVLEAEVAYLDVTNDVCSLVVAGIAGEVATLGDDPPVGAVVTHVGSPSGISWVHESFVADGRYMGRRKVTNDGELLYLVSAPADHGSSGGGVFYRGRLFGLVSRVHESFKHIAFLTGGEPLRKARAEGRKRCR